MISFLVSELAHLSLVVLTTALGVVAVSTTLLACCGGKKNETQVRDDSQQVCDLFMKLLLFCENREQIISLGDIFMFDQTDQKKQEWKKAKLQKPSLAANLLKYPVTFDELKKMLLNFSTEESISKAYNIGNTLLKGDDKVLFKQVYEQHLEPCRLIKQSMNKK